MSGSGTARARRRAGAAAFLGFAAANALSQAAPSGGIGRCRFCRIRSSSTQRSAARVLHLLGTRAEVHLHGACIGSGIEVPMAAARRTGRFYSETEFDLSRLDD